MWLSTVDSSHILTLATMHAFIMICILLFSAVTNSLAETPIGANVESEKGAESNKELQQLDGESGGVIGSKAMEEEKCWLVEDFTTQGPCEQCNDFQRKQSAYCCGETGFRQRIQCKSGKTTYKSCHEPRWAVEKSFWTFEGVMLALGMCSGFVALMRRRKLDWKALERVRKQIANSV